MKVSERKRRANQENAQKSTGPSTPEGKLRSGHNAVQHGLTASTLIFENEAEQARYDQVLADFRSELKSTNKLQDFMLQQIVASQILSERAQRWISREMTNRNGAAVGAMLDTLMGKTKAVQLPLPGLISALEAGGNASSDWSPWEMGDLEVNLVGGEHANAQSQEASSGAGRVHSKSEAKREGSGNTQRYELHLRLADKLERLRRYDSTIKRDLYRAVEVWQRLNK